MIFAMIPDQYFVQYKILLKNVFSIKLISKCLVATDLLFAFRAFNKDCIWKKINFGMLINDL